jgi:serine/threonine protein kinase
MGSPHYMSPEQTESSVAVDQRSDIWSLGTTLYKLLSGRIAFDGETEAEISAHVLCRNPVALARLNAEIPRAIDDIVSRCLEKTPERRFTSVAELASALAPFGTPDARSSAESIARILRRRDGSWSEDGIETIRPIAAEIAAIRPLRRRRTLGYVLGSAISLTTLVGAGTLVLRTEPLRRRPAAQEGASEGSPFLSPPVTLSAASAIPPQGDAGGEEMPGQRKAL